MEARTTHPTTHPTAGSPRTQQAACGKCGHAVELRGRLMIGEVVDCPGCRAPLEVAQVAPLRLEPFSRVEEDPDDLLRGFEDFELL